MRLVIIIFLLTILVIAAMQVHEQLMRANRLLQTIELHLRVAMAEPDLPQP